ncbi:S41 family peptidase [Sneathiella chinensis]|uniref:PDZ domain-containing protein n=1 Tax=Sneathiella chinensis TaxID=349750 RepID=A0ABQ5U0Y1_9PROT|nr:S41 family peptidase [Sneathiella chinensis]GLQ05330.1 hypothetical protein GCM10007924_05510 [Sneathiella chinensis]
MRKLLITANLLALLTACALPFVSDEAVTNAVDRYEAAYLNVIGPSDTLNRDVDTLEDALITINARYVDEVNLDDLVDEAIRGLRNTSDSTPPTTRALNALLASLDKFSGYMPPETYSRYQQSLDGDFIGFGVRIEMRDDELTVLSPIAGSAAEEAGILSGDVITHQDGDPLSGLSLHDAVSKLRGPEGSSSVLTIQRDGEDTPLKLTVTRRRVELHSVEYKADGDIGYIRILSFNRKTGDEVEDALKAINRDLGGRFCGVILDLRNNPGGLVSSAIDVADQFLDQGHILKAMNRGNSFTEERAARGDSVHGLPMIIMINQGSASAAEIVAGALQSNGRARLFGEKSYGKGSMQTLFDLENGGGLRLTTGRFTVGRDLSFNHIGLTPDIRDADTGQEQLLAPIGRASRTMMCNPSLETAAAAHAQ